MDGRSMFTFQSVPLFTHLLGQVRKLSAAPQWLLLVSKSKASEPLSEGRSALPPLYMSWFFNYLTTDSKRPVTAVNQYWFQIIRITFLGQQLTC